MLEELKKYLSNTLGTEPVFNESEDVQAKMPLALSRRYSLHLCDVFGKEVCFALDKGTTTPSGYEKEARLIERVASVPVVIVCRDISPVDVHRMIGRRIDFIVPGKRMFMPSLMIDLDGRRAAEDIPDKIPPLSQMIVLYHIQIGNLNGFDAKDIAEKFGATYLTASRAVKWIGDKICPLKKEGRLCRLDFPEADKLLSLAKQFLRNPVIKRVYTDDSLADIVGTVAGESALEEYSMIAPTGDCKAVGKGIKVNIVPDDRGENCIEYWMYDPKALSDGGICDRLSLILSFEDNADERIHKEVEKLKTETGW